MSAFIIDKRDINTHTDLKEELRLIADTIEERDSTFIYRTVPEKFSAFIKLLNAYHVEFLVKNY